MSLSTSLNVTVRESQVKTPVILVEQKEVMIETEDGLKFLIEPYKSGKGVILTSVGSLREKRQWVVKPLSRFNIVLEKE